MFLSSRRGRLLEVLRRRILDSTNWPTASPSAAAVSWSSGLGGLVEGAVTEHGKYDVAAASGQGDQCLVVQSAALGFVGALKLDDVTDWIRAEISAVTL